MTQNGISTCTALGSEKYEEYKTRIGRKEKKFVQYDYRHTDGELFSCVKPTLEECRTARNEWLNRKNK